MVRGHLDPLNQIILSFCFTEIKDLFFQKSLESIMIQFFRELTVKHPCSIKYVYIYVIE